MKRLLPFLVFAFALAISGQAFAATADTHTDRPSAYSHCMTEAATLTAQSGHSPSCQYNPGNFNPPAGYSYYAPCLSNGSGNTGETGGCWAGVRSTDHFHQFPVGTNNGCPSGTTWDAANHTCQAPCSTSAPPLASNMTVQIADSASGYINVCSGGCGYQTTGLGGNGYTYKVDGQWYQNVGGYTPTGATCTANTTTVTPPSDTDGDGTSDGKDGAPNDPGSTGTPDPTDTDPTCGGAGQPQCPDKTDPNAHTSTGGGDCSTPPNSSGDPILAQIAFQTWATRCQLQKNANTGTGGNGGVVGGTDMSATNSKLDGIKGTLDGIKSTLDVTGADTTDGSDGHGSDSLWGADETGDTFVADESGLGWGTSCPAPPHLAMLGGADIDWSGMCTLMGYVGLLVLAMAHAHALYIFMGD